MFQKLSQQTHLPSTQVPKHAPSMHQCLPRQACLHRTAACNGEVSTQSVSCAMYLSPALVPAAVEPCTGRTPVADKNHVGIEGIAVHPLSADRPTICGVLDVQ